MNRRDFIKAMGAACAALAVPKAWARSKKPHVFYADQIRIFVNGVEIKGLGVSDLRVTNFRRMEIA